MIIIRLLRNACFLSYIFLASISLEGANDNIEILSKTKLERLERQKQTEMVNHFRQKDLNLQKIKDWRSTSERMIRDTYYEIRSERAHREHSIRKHAASIPELRLRNNNLKESDFVLARHNLLKAEQEYLRSLGKLNVTEQNNARIKWRKLHLEDLQRIEASRPSITGQPISADAAMLHESLRNAQTLADRKAASDALRRHYSNHKAESTTRR